ncbi:hypothetical protein [Methylomicrobium sp. Wu6]|uniref:hypothetical protein n=1 Tax=Methylomicrobium sp. Wu6 TaxID=3107928 RepID=UPI002DD69580|nr:hypothetical protein [Methylomicrobium sp. Wu6]MEC4747963.1 hypothetical protein [Methylomicrobium sp. Wu6]
MYYDLEAIRRFVDAISKNLNEASSDIAHKRASGQQIDTADELDKITLIGVELADIRAAHRALAALLYGNANLKKELGLKRKTGKKTKLKFDMTIHSPEFMVLCSLEGGALTYGDAVGFLQDGWGAGQTTAEEFIRDRRAAAKQFNACFPTGPEKRQPFLSKAEIEEMIKNKKSPR